MTETTTGTLIINPYGNGFVNLADKTIYIPRKDISFAINLDTVQVEYNQLENGQYTGKIINYSLVDREFIGRMHHTYKNNAFIYVSELKKHLVAIPLDEFNKAGIYLNKNSWMRIQIGRASCRERV